MDYQEFKKKALESEPVTYKVSLSDIEILSEGLIQVKGFTLPIARPVLKDLAKALKIPQNFINEFESNLGTEVKNKFINFIKNAIMASKNITVTLVGNKETKTILAIHRGDILPYEVYFRLFEDLMNKYPFDIKDMHIFNDGMSISTILRENQFHIPGTEVESFYPGFTLKQSVDKGTILDSFIYRLVCSNGMIAPDGNDPIKFDPSNPMGYNGVADDFFRRIDKLAENGLIPNSFTDNVVRAMNTKASFNEMKSAAYQISNTSALVKDFIDNFIPINSSKTQLIGKGIELTKLNPMQEKSIITGSSVWDLINGITDYASHDYGFHVTPQDKIKLQMHANVILTKKSFDTANLVGVSLVN